MAHNNTLAAIEYQFRNQRVDQFPGGNLLMLTKQRPLLGIHEMRVWVRNLNWTNGATVITLPTGDGILANNPAGTAFANRWMFADGVANQSAVIITQDQLNGTMVRGTNQGNATRVRLNPALPTFVQVNDIRSGYGNNTGSFDLVVRIGR